MVEGNPDTSGVVTTPSDNPDPFRDDDDIYIDPTKTASDVELPPIPVGDKTEDSDEEDKEGKGKVPDMPNSPYGNNKVEVKTDAGDDAGDDVGVDPRGDPGGNSGGKTDLETYDSYHSDSA